jgi:hypothetical protein
MEVSDEPHVPVALLLQKVASIHIEYEAEWAPDSVRMLWIRGKESLAAAGNLTPAI